MAIFGKTLVDEKVIKEMDDKFKELISENETLRKRNKEIRKKVEEAKKEAYKIVKKDIVNKGLTSVLFVKNLATVSLEKTTDAVKDLLSKTKQETWQEKFKKNFKS